MEQHQEIISRIIQELDWEENHLRERNLKIPPRYKREIQHVYTKQLGNVRWTRYSYNTLSDGPRRVVRVEATGRSYLRVGEKIYEVGPWKKAMIGVGLLWLSSITILPWMDSRRKAK